MKGPLILAAIAIVIAMPAFAQRKHPKSSPPVADTTKPKTVPVPAVTMPKPGPKPYKEVITDKAVSQNGLFTVHKAVYKPCGEECGGHL